MSHIKTAEQHFHSLFNENLISLEKAKRKINSQINDSLRKDDFVSLGVYTKLYLLLYSSWTEASLVKLVHTPSGFGTDDKRKILKDQDVLNKWKKCINTAFSKLRKNGSEIPNKKKKIHSLLDEYLQTQANIRNKIAHGQWEYPLHKNNIDHDANTQLLISLIDIIQIDTWFAVFAEIIEIVRGLIDSKAINNHKAHYLFYYERLTNIQNIIQERKSYSLEEKTKKLKLKPRK